MNAGIQMALVALLLGWSVWVMLRRWFPAGTGALLNRLADRAGAHGLAHLARWLRPVVASGGCDSNCGGCRTGCATPAIPEQPVQWRQPPSSGSCH